MTKKKARALCRQLAVENRVSWWQLCWNKQNGFYPANHYGAMDSNFVAYVDKNGEFKHISAKKAYLLK